MPRVWPHYVLSISPKPDVQAVSNFPITHMLTEEAAICPFSSLLGVKGSHIGTEQKQPGVFWMESHPLTSRRVCWPVGSYLEAGCGGPPQEIWPLCGALPPGDLNFLGRERALHPPADGEYEDWGVSAPLRLRFSGWWAGVSTSPCTRVVCK